MRQKIFSILLGIFTVLVVFEFALRVAGYINKKEEHNVKHRLKNSDYRVLCVGNSYTKGLGAPEEGSYPSHLQRMLDQHFGGNRVDVINYGRAAWNTSQVLSNLEQFIYETKPNLIVLRTGGPNWFNPKGYPFFQYDWDYYEYLLFEHIRFLKFIKGISRHVFDKTSLVFKESNKEYSSFEFKEEILNINKWFDRCYNYDTFSVCDEGRRNVMKVDKVISFYLKLLKHFPDDFLTYLKLSILYLEFKEDVSSSLNIIYKAIDHAIDINNYEWQHNFYFRLRIYDKFLNDNSEKQRRRKTYISKVEAAIPYDKRFIDAKDNDKIPRWVVSDLDEIVDIIKSKGIALLLHNYPPHPTSKRRLINSVLRKYAKENKVNFVDLEELFFNKKNRGEDISRYYFQIYGKLDRHLNSNGYRVNAQAVFDFLIEIMKLKVKVYNKRPARSAEAFDI